MTFVLPLLYILKKHLKLKSSSILSIDSYLYDFFHNQYMLTYLIKSEICVFKCIQGCDKCDIFSFYPRLNEWVIYSLYFYHLQFLQNTPFLSDWGLDEITSFSSRNLTMETTKLTKHRNPPQTFNQNVI